MKQILDSLGFQNIAITAKGQSDKIIQSWNIGKGTEKIVFSAYIRGVKPARKPANESPGCKPKRPEGR